MRTHLMRFSTRPRLKRKGVSGGVCSQVRTQRSHDLNIGTIFLSHYFLLPPHTPFIVYSRFCVPALLFTLFTTKPPTLGSITILMNLYSSRSFSPPIVLHQSFACLFTLFDFCGFSKGSNMGSTMHLRSLSNKLRMNNFRVVFNTV